MVQGSYSGKIPLKRRSLAIPERTAKMSRNQDIDKVKALIMLQMKQKMQ